MPGGINRKTRNQIRENELHLRKNLRQKRIATLLEGRAAKLYGELPFHNWNHARSRMKKGMAIARQCVREGIRVNLEVVKWALLFHDAGYHHDHRKIGYPTKEAHSAALARKEMERLNMDPMLIRDVEKAILSTHRDAPFQTVEEKIVRAADLAGMAGPYSAFLRDNRLLKKEQELMHGNSISWEEWKKQSEEIIGFYLSQNIQVTTQYRDAAGKSVFHTRVRDNLARMMREQG